MTIVVETTTNANSGTGSEDNLAFPAVTIPDKSGIAVVAFVFDKNGGVTVDAITRTGGSMTSLFSEADTSAKMWVWYEVDVPSGSTTYTVDVSSANFKSIMLVVLSGVNTSDPFRDQDGVWCECDGQSLTLSTVPGDLLIGAVGHSFDRTEGYTPTSPGTELIDVAGANGGSADDHRIFMMRQSADSDLDTTIAYTKTGNRRQAFTAVALRSNLPSGAPIFFP